MGYCNVVDITRVIAQSLTSSTAQSPNDFGNLSNLMNIGNTFDRNLIPEDIVNYYIQLSDSEVDATLSELYKTPFRESVTFDTYLFSSIDEHNMYIVTKGKCPLVAGDEILLKYEENEERHIIDKVEGLGVFSTINEIGFYFPEGTRILRMSYPDPLRFMSARLSAGSIYDKYFSSEASPNMSKFGETMRSLAYDRINDILSGKIILHGQHRIGRRFFNPNLVDQYGLPKDGDLTRGN